MSTPNMFNGMRIITSLDMVEEGTPYEVKRTWKERLFTLPWKPFYATKTVVPLIPKQTATFLPNGTLVMHPEMYDKIQKENNYETKHHKADEAILLPQAYLGRGDGT